MNLIETLTNEIYDYYSTNYSSVISYHHMGFQIVQIYKKKTLDKYQSIIPGCYVVFSIYTNLILYKVFVTTDTDGTPLVSSNRLQDDTIIRMADLINELKATTKKYK